MAEQRFIESAIDGILNESRSLMLLKEAVGGKRIESLDFGKPKKFIERGDTWNAVISRLLRWF